MNFILSNKRGPSPVHPDQRQDGLDLRSGLLQNLPHRPDQCEERSGGWDHSGSNRRLGGVDRSLQRRLGLVGPGELLSEVLASRSAGVERGRRRLRGFAEDEIWKMGRPQLLRSPPVPLLLQISRFLFESLFSFSVFIINILLYFLFLLLIHTSNVQLIQDLILLTIVFYI